MDVEMIDFKISTILEARDTNTKPYSFRAALDEISSPRWLAQVEEVRRAFASGGKDAAAGPKKKLPGILFSGTFKTRNKDALIQHSGLICVDLDNLGEQVEGTRDLIVQDPHTLAAFISPTGTGLKVVFKCDPTKDHYLSFRAAGEYVLRNFGLEIDEACKDVNRICFVSHDPDLFSADDAEMLPYPDPVKEFHVPLDKPKTGIPETTPGDDYDSRGDIGALLRSHGWTQVGRHGWRRPDKTKGVSATFDKVPGRFYVFSSSTQFQSNHVYKPWHVYAILECNGDFRAAARKLGLSGYGDQRQMTKAPIPNDGGEVPDETWEEVPAAVEPKINRLSSKRVRLANQPTEPTTRLFLAGKPIATPGNLVTLISRAKTGKTATIGAAVAAIIAAHHDRPDMDTFGFTAPHTKEAVILIDTEQSPYDAFECHRRALSRAGEQADPDWLCHYALVGESAEQLGKDLLAIIAEAKAAHGGIFTIILDGVADFVQSVNDEAECNNFISWLRSVAVDNDCPIMCVIHSNEAVKAGDDGRGHLGKQLTRKAESNLLLKKVGEVTTITSEKQRKAPITESDGVAFRWDNILGRHVSCPATSQTTVKGGRPKKYDFETFQKAFPREASKAETRQVILRKAQDFSDIKDTAFRAILADGVQSGQLIQTETRSGYLYHLSLPGA